MGIDKDMYDMVEEEREYIKGQIENYILYFTSDDKERKQMLNVLEDFMEEVYED